MENASPQDMVFILPELLLAVTFLIAIILTLVARRKDGHLVAAASIAGLLLSVMASWNMIGYQNMSLFAGMIESDAYGRFFQMLVGIGAAATILISAYTKEISEESSAGSGEYYALILAATLGMYFLVESTNLVMLYLSMEMLSLSSYLLTGWLTRNRRSTEAGIKYIIFGAAASCAMIYGISLVYGISGTFSLDGLRAYLVATPDVPPIFAVATGLVLAGFLFKIAAFPLFQWAPDVYQGAPTPIAAYLAVGSKAAGMAILVRFLFVGFVNFDPAVGLKVVGRLDWPLVIAFVSAATMTLGNFMAIWQNNIKRLLAYSSIAHAGYMLMALPTMSGIGIKAVAFYLAVYLIMNLGAFLVVIIFENRGVPGEIPAWRGMGGRSPAAAIAMCIFLFSLVGLPPFAGFIGKIYVFTALISAKIYWLAIVGALNSVVSLYYYARIVKAMYLEKSDETAEAIVPDRPLVVVAWVLAVPTLVLGVYWEPLLRLAEKAASSIGI